MGIVDEQNEKITETKKIIRAKKKAKGEKYRKEKNLFYISK